MDNGLEMMWNEVVVVCVKILSPWWPGETEKMQTIISTMNMTGDIWKRRLPDTRLSINHIQQDAKYAGIYLLQNHFTCFGYPSHPSSGIHKTVTAASGTGHSVRAATFLQRGKFGHVGGRLLLRYYDLYQRLQLQFYVILMMGTMYTRNI